MFALASLLLASLLLAPAYRLDGVSVDVRCPRRVTVGEEIAFTLSFRNDGPAEHRYVRVERPLLPWDGQWRGARRRSPGCPRAGRRARVVHARFVARGEHHIDPLERGGARAALARAGALAPDAGRPLRRGPEDRARDVVRRSARTAVTSRAGSRQRRGTGEPTDLLGVRPTAPAIRCATCTRARGRATARRWCASTRRSTSRGSGVVVDTDVSVARRRRARGAPCRSRPASSRAWRAARRGSTCCSRATRRTPSRRSATSAPSSRRSTSSRPCNLRTRSPRSEPSPGSGRTWRRSRRSSWSSSPGTPRARRSSAAIRARGAACVVLVVAIATSANPTGRGSRSTRSRVERRSRCDPRAPPGAGRGGRARQGRRRLAPRGGDWLARDAPRDDRTPVRGGSRAQAPHRRAGRRRRLRRGRPPLRAPPGLPRRGLDALRRGGHPRGGRAFPPRGDRRPGGDDVARLHRAPGRRRDPVPRVRRIRRALSSDQRLGSRGARRARDGARDGGPSARGGGGGAAPGRRARGGSHSRCPARVPVDDEPRALDGAPLDSPDRLLRPDRHRRARRAPRFRHHRAAGARSARRLPARRRLSTSMQAADGSDPTRWRPRPPSSSKAAAPDGRWREDHGGVVADGPVLSPARGALSGDRARGGARGPDRLDRSATTIRGSRPSASSSARATGPFQRPRARPICRSPTRARSPRGAGRTLGGSREDAHREARRASSGTSRRSSATRARSRSSADPTRCSTSSS